MADPARRPPADLKQALLTEGNQFSFFQAVRLLRYFIARASRRDSTADPLREQIRIRPDLSLGHPPNETVAIEERPDETPRYLITAGFLGLYGESSPLPAFYTEDLIEEELENLSVNRDFLDIINYPLYLLFHRIWTKYRVHVRVSDEHDPLYLEILYSLMGLGVEPIREKVLGSFQLLRYIGLFSQFPRSGLGLKRLLCDALSEPRIGIEPCILRRAVIPADQRLLLGVSGNVLGRESYLGETIDDRTTKFRVEVGPLSSYDYNQYLPGTFKYNKIAALSRLYLMDPFESDIKLTLEAGEARTARLGDAEWCRLGLDTWLISDGYARRLETVFELR